MRRYSLVLLAIALVATGAPARAADTRWSLGVGAEYTSGDYGAAQSTEIFYLPLTLKAERGRHYARLALPYLIVSAPTGGEVIAIDDDGPPIVSGDDGRRQTESGIGDIVATYGLNIIDRRAAGTVIDIVTKVKLGTADEARGLGTGENDYSLQLDGFSTQGRLTLLGTVGYKLLGDPPGTDLNDVFFGSLGTSLRYNAANSIGLIYDYRQATTATAADQGELTVYLNRKTARANRLQFYALAGLSDTSPDWGAGVVFTAVFE